MEEKKSTFIITREDQAVDSVTLVSDGLRIGRLPECEVVLNHPMVSRLHAGIKEIDNRFYLVNLSQSNTTTLNGRLIPAEQAEALAGSDEVQVGPFTLFITRTDKALNIRVIQQIALNIGDKDYRAGSTGLLEQGAVPVAAPASADVADALKVFWDKRTRTKAARPSPLHPRHPPRPGKIRFNWTPTRDLVRPWPFSIFIWGVLVIGALSVAAALGYTAAYSPGPISDVHAKNRLDIVPAVAKQPNANSCMHCHTVRGSINENCASCHQTSAFAPTIIPEHTTAGLGCTSCHREHQGVSYRPDEAALVTCATCHSNDNKGAYNGPRLSAPHGGQPFGYPVRVINNAPRWVWKGLKEQELADRPDIARLYDPCDAEKTDRQKICVPIEKGPSTQFHALHVSRVRAIGGLPGVVDRTSGVQVMSCSSCHNSFYPIDRGTPKATCSKCHGNTVEGKVMDPLLPANAPNCNSCHVQHLKDKHHWDPDLLAPTVRTLLQAGTAGAGQSALRSSLAND